MLVHAAAHATRHIACAHDGLRVASTTSSQQDCDMMLHTAAQVTRHSACAHVGLRVVSPPFHRKTVTCRRTRLRKLPGTLHVPMLVCVWQAQPCSQ